MHTADGPVRAPAAEVERKRRRARTALTRERPEARSPVAGGAMLVLPIAAVVVALRGYLWWEQGELLALAVLGGLVAAGLGLLAFGAQWLQRRAEPLSPALVERKPTQPLFRASLEVVCIGPRGSGPERLRALVLGSRCALSTTPGAAASGRSGKGWTGFGLLRGPLELFRNKFGTLRELSELLRNSCGTSCERLAAGFPCIAARRPRVPA